VLNLVITPELTSNPFFSSNSLYGTVVTTTITITGVRAVGS